MRLTTEAQRDTEIAQRIKLRASSVFLCVSVVNSRLLISQLHSEPLRKSSPLIALL